MSLENTTVGCREQVECVRALQMGMHDVWHSLFEKMIKNQGKKMIAAGIEPATFSGLYT